MTVFQVSRVMNQYLTGLEGVEIGASAHNPFGLNTINIDCVQHTEGTISGKSQLELCGKISHVDIIANAWELPLKNKSYDFVISSHVLEHLYSPIHAIKEWKRVAKKYIALIVPEKSRCGEGDKETTWKEIKKREKDFDPEKKAHTEDKHHTFWDVALFKEFCEKMNLNLIVINDRDDKVGNGFLAIIEL